MYNLNVDLATSAANAVNSLLVENSGGTTPRTPEILNSLIAMTNPLDGYSFCNEDVAAKAKRANHQNHHHGRSASSNLVSNTNNNNSSDSNSSTSSQLESPTSSYPPSVQHTCSQLIKAGLKLTIEQKRKHHYSQSDDGGDERLLDLDKVKRSRRSECSESEEDKVKQEHGLTPEDEERRRRRRERNKIAATKCRLKKRERTANLIQESETLETQNVDLKGQLQDLQNQKRSLAEALALHRPHCRHKIGPATREHLYRLPPVSSVMETHGYSQQRLEEEAAAVTASRSSQSFHQTTCFARQPQQQQQPPEIVVEEIGPTGFDDLGPFDGFVDTYDDSANCHGYNGYAELGNGCMA